MSYGYFVNGNGQPVYRGHRANKPGLEAGHAFIPAVDDTDHIAVGNKRQGDSWVPDPDASARRSTVLARRAFNRSAREDLPVVLDALIRALIASGAINPQDFTSAERQAYQRWRTAVGNLP